MKHPYFTFFISTLSSSVIAAVPYPIVDTGQAQCFNPSSASQCSDVSRPLFGQDAHYQGNQPNYQQNNDGTVTDQVTKLMWTQSTDTNGDGIINAQDKMTYEEALRYTENLELAGQSDWRLPSIKELYSLVLFDGQDPSGLKQEGQVALIPFIDQRVFDINAGDTQAGERLIDSQFVSSTRYVTTTMRNDPTVFGVNFIDGRIKGYGMRGKGGKDKTFYVLAVRGNTDYGQNQFVEQNTGTVSDKATSLIWQKEDSQSSMKWPQALQYCQDLTLDGRTDWRLPNIKELQSLVDYTRSPNTSQSAAIDPLFSATQITNEAGQSDYANYWSSTTHQNMRNGANAAYVAFGRSMGKMNGQWLDVHGAGSQRSDPKSGRTDSYPDGHGPQGDAVRVENMVRCVTGGVATDNREVMDEKRQSQTFFNHQTTGSQSLGSYGNPSKQKGKKSFPPGMDKNGDGKISRYEAKGPLKKDFNRLDKNNDGYLSSDELPPRP